MLRTLIVSLLFLTSLFGESSKDFSFMGLSASTQNINIFPGESFWESGLALKYGQQSMDWRTIFNLDYTTNSYYGAFLEIDKILLDDMFGTAKLRPYLGGVVGYMNVDKDKLAIALEKVDPEDFELFEETNGFYFGGNLGFIIYATDDIDIDLSYHYYKVQNLDYMDDLHGASLGAHYFF